MNTRLFLFSVFFLGIVLVACSIQDTSTPVPTATTVPTPTDTPIKATPTRTSVDSAGQSTALVTVDVSAVAQGVTLQVVAPVQDSADAPWWATMPEYTLQLIDRRRTVALQIGEEMGLRGAHTQLRRLVGQVQPDLAGSLVNRR